MLSGAIVLILCVGVTAGCGGSGQFSPTQREAIRAAQRQNGVLGIFPNKEAGPISCALSPGRIFHITNGRCMTFVSVYRKWPIIDFVERYDLGHRAAAGAYLVVLNPHGRIVAFHVRGSVADELR